MNIIAWDENPWLFLYARTQFVWSLVCKYLNMSKTIRWLEWVMWQIATHRIRVWNLSFTVHGVNIVIPVWYLHGTHDSFLTTLPRASLLHQMVSHEWRHLSRKCTENVLFFFCCCCWVEITIWNLHLAPLLNVESAQTPLQLTLISYFTLSRLDRPPLN